MARVNKGSTLFRPIKKPGAKTGAAKAANAIDNATIAPATPRATQAPSQAAGSSSMPPPSSTAGPSFGTAAPAAPAAQLPPTPAATQPEPPKKRPSLIAAASSSPAPDTPAREFVPRRSASITPRDRERERSRSRYTSITPARELADDAVPIGRPGVVRSAPRNQADEAVPIGRPGQRNPVPVIASAQSEDYGEAVPRGKPGVSQSRRETASPSPEATPLVGQGQSRAPRLSQPDESVEEATTPNRQSGAVLPFNVGVGEADPDTLAAALEAARGVNSIPNDASSSRGAPLVFKKRADGSVSAVPDPEGGARPRGRPKHPDDPTPAEKQPRKPRKDIGTKRPRTRKADSVALSVDGVASTHGSASESETGSTVLVRRKPKRRKGIPNDRMDVAGLEANEMVGEVVDLSTMSMADLTRAHDFGRISARAITIQERKAEQQPQRDAAKKEAERKKARVLRAGELRQIKIRNFMRKQRRAELASGTAERTDLENGVSSDEDEALAGVSDDDGEDEEEDDGDAEAKAERKRRRAALLQINELAKPDEEPDAEEEEEMDIGDMVFADDEDAPWYDEETESWVHPGAERIAIARAQREQEQDDIINDEDAEVEEIRDTDTWVNSRSFMPKGKAVRGRKWNKQETEALYMALSMFGESASIIHQTIFHYMTLGQVKGKLRRENLDRPEKVTLALKNKVKLDRGLLESILGVRLNQKTEHEKPLPSAQKEELQEMEEDQDQGVKVAPSAEPPAAAAVTSEAEAGTGSQGESSQRLPATQESAEEADDDLPTALELLTR